MNRLIPVVSAISTIFVTPTCVNNNVNYSQVIIIDAGQESDTKEETNTSTSFYKYMDNEETSRLTNDVFRNLMYKDLYNQLLNLLDDVEQNEEIIYSFWNCLNEKIFLKDFFEWCFPQLESTMKYHVLSSLLSSDVDVFDKWYVQALKESASSNNEFLSLKARSILRLYPDRFTNI